MATEDSELSEREQAVVRALHHAAATERAPAQLRQRLEFARPAGRAHSRFRPGGRWSGSWAGAAVLVVVAITSAVLLIPGGSPGAPSISAAAALATRGAVSAAPAADPSASYRLTARVGTLHFPNWAKGQGWRAVGSRTDRLGNRTVTTVYYMRDSRTIAYSIVSSPALGSPGLQTLSTHGRTVVVWREHGHTCLLSGPGVALATLVHLTSARVS